jgi:mevalonate kinase
MKKTFYSNGKLLITGEYLVLNGAKALALPTKFGQNLIVENSTNNKISWKSYDHDKTLWFEAQIDISDIIINNKSSSDQTIKNTLIEILHQAYLLNPSFIDSAAGYKVETHLSFPKSWGLGTSSTLINNIAQWAVVDAFVLLQNSFGGSGYDIACAQNDSAIVYNLQDGKPQVEVLDFRPAYTNNIYFVYLNQKQSSKSAIEAFKKKQFGLEDAIKTINQITETIIKTNNQNIFAQELQKHEGLMSQILETQTVKETLFPDFEGTIKSLGAWGGDFVLVISNVNPTAYFNKKGYEVVLRYDEMILK